jgi:hypothetical protein
LHLLCVFVASDVRAGPASGVIIQGAAEHQQEKLRWPAIAVSLMLTVAREPMDLILSALKSLQPKQI